MRIDVITIFPDYLAPLGLSLIGRARGRGLLDIRVHDLRDHAHDRHRTVDDAPFGGGAGMVMTPQPWADALDGLLGAEERTAPGTNALAPTLIVPSPAGEPFTQAMAKDLASHEWIVFACGRYEGIDERVHTYATERMPVRTVSLGDYVLNGGEVAALAMIEAIARLIPGVVGNAESIVEESHEDGLLEYPVFTKPARWTHHGVTRDVPQVLLSGDHGAIATWRHTQRMERTAARRPDLVHPSSAVADLRDLDVAVATPADAPEVLVLGRACWAPEFARYGLFGAGKENLADVVADLGAWETWLFRSGGRLVASVRGRPAPDDPDTWQIGRLMVAPDLQGRGLGRALLAFAESRAPATASTLWLNTGAEATRLLRMYRRAGYRVRPGEGAHLGTVDLAKPR